jgi:hypothetical protein
MQFLICHIDNLLNQSLPQLLLHILDILRALDDSEPFLREGLNGLSVDAVFGHVLEGGKGCAVGFEELVAGGGVRVEACYACGPSGGAEDCCPAHCQRTLVVMAELADCGSLGRGMDQPHPLHDLKMTRNL